MIIKAFKDVPDKKIIPTGDLYGKDYLDNMSAIQVGYGSKAFKSDQSGIWLGANKFADAPFSVDMLGNAILSSATITGMGVNFVSTVTWTATDLDTATWGAGTIKTSGGTSYSISGGNTGNITTTTYVYLDPATSTTVLQTSTTATDAAGDGKILIAIVQKGATGAKCIIDVVGSHGTTIDGDRITTGKIQSADGNTYFDLDGDEIQIQDDSSTTVIDSKGLLGSTSFVSGNAVKTSNQTPTYDTWTDITQLTHTITLTRTTPIFFFGSILYVGQTTNTTMGVRVSLDNSSYFPNSSGWSITNFAGGDGVWFTIAGILNGSNGSNVLHVEAYGGTVSEDQEVGEESNFGYIVLGK